MNSIKLKSNSEGFELEISTDQPQTPRQMAEAVMDIVKAAPPPAISNVIEVKESAPMLTVSEAPANAQAASGDTQPARTSRSKRRNVTAGAAEKAQGPSAEERISELINAGKFDTPQDATTVWEDLERMTHHYSKPRVSNALAALVGKKKLDRIGPRGEYRYVRYGISQTNVHKEAGAIEVALDQSETPETTLDVAIAQA